MEYLQWHRMLLLYSVSGCAALPAISALARERECHDVFDGDHIQSRFIENISEFGFVLPKS